MAAKSGAVKALTGGIVHLFKQNKVNMRTFWCSLSCKCERKAGSCIYTVQFLTSVHSFNIFSCHLYA